MRYNILDTPVDDTSLDKILDNLIRGQRVVHCFVNIHKIVLFNTEKSLQELINNENCIFSPDGRWILFLSKIFRFPIKKSFGGLNIIDAVSTFSEKMSLKVYLLGAKRDIILKVKKTLQEKFSNLNVIGYHDGYFQDKEYIVNDIIEKQPNILFIALPSPQKELLANELFQRVLSLMYVAGVGGAFDIIANRHKRAPIFIQNVGLEWLYRSIQKPELFKRYIEDSLTIIKLFIKNVIQR
ncbi:MAG: WecB/TagA/CpsF family glycosyltransferase [Candidatus Omnitrophota bacterium]